MALTIRPYEDADRDFVLSLVPRFTDFVLPEWGDVDAMEATNRADLEKALDAKATDVAVFVAEDDGELLGFVHVQAERDYFSGLTNGYVADIAVGADQEGRGVGRALMAVAEEWTREQGFSRLTLFAFASNERARRFYEQLGFEPSFVKYSKTVE